MARIGLGSLSPDSWLPSDFVPGTISYFCILMQNVVIIGGGFAGLHLARKLSGAGYRILVIDRQNYHQFQPLFYQVATARLEPSTISFPFRKIFQRFRDIEFRLAEVVSIEPAAKQIILTDGKINYDKLIIASGCNTNYFGNELIQKRVQHEIHRRSHPDKE